MDRGIYSPLKIFHHREQIEDLKAGRRPRLIHVQIVPTNRCNQRCRFCAYRNFGYSSSQSFNQKDEIPTVKLLEVAESLRRMGVQGVEITGGGEPTLHEGYYDFCGKLRESEIGYGVVTNGSVDSSLVDDALAGAAWVRFSVDAGCSETYATIRKSRGEVYDDVRARIQRISSLKNGRRDPVIGVGFVVTRDNWREVFLAAAEAKQDGADNFRISAEFQNEGAGHFREFFPEASALCREAETLNDGEFKVFNLFGDRVDDLSQKSPTEPFCGFQHLCTYVGADQNVYRCCVVSYNELGLIGSIKKQTLESLWDSVDTAVKLKDFDARKCPRCMYNAKNASIAYAIDPSPPHVEFI